MKMALIVCMVFRQLYFLYGWPVLKLMQWNLELDSLQNEFTVIPENFSTTEMMNWNKTVQFYGRGKYHYAYTFDTSTLYLLV